MDSGKYIGTVSNTIKTNLEKRHGDCDCKVLLQRAGYKTEAILYWAFEKIIV